MQLGECHGSYLLEEKMRAENTGVLWFLLWKNYAEKVIGVNEEGIILGSVIVMKLEKIYFPKSKQEQTEK